MAKVLAEYEHKVGNEIRMLPVHVDDVDELGIWVHVEPEPGTVWSTMILWSRVIEQNLPSAIKLLQEDMAKQELANPQPEETT